MSGLKPILEVRYKGWVYVGWNIVALSLEGTDVSKPLVKLFNALHRNDGSPGIWYVHPSLALVPGAESFTAEDFAETLRELLAVEIVLKEIK